MDEKRGLGVRNWNFSDQPANVNPLMKPIANDGVHGGTMIDSSSNVSEHHPAFLKMHAFPSRNSLLSEAAEYSDWVHHRNFQSATKPGSNPMHSNEANPEASLTDIHMVLSPPIDAPQNYEVDTKPKKKKQPSSKRPNHVATKVFRAKQPKKTPTSSTKKQDSSLSSLKREKKNLDVVFDGTAMDFSHVPSPICSCTGVARQCYKWGAGGWQSSCCTISISEYPLPMSSSRPGARLAGRKMSNGAYLKLLQRLAAEGHDLSSPVDLKNHWARHGTNKFVTIK